MSNNKNILQIIDSSFLGIIWASEQKIDYNLKFYSQLDYLFDGLITISKTKISERKKAPFLLQAKSFGLPLFFFIPLDPNNIHEIMNMAKSRSNDTKRNILIINDQKKDLSSGPYNPYKKDLSFSELIL